MLGALHWAGDTWNFICKAENPYFKEGIRYSTHARVRAVLGTVGQITTLAGRAVEGGNEPSEMPEGFLGSLEAVHKKKDLYCVTRWSSVEVTGRHFT